MADLATVHKLERALAKYRGIGFRVVSRTHDPLRVRIEGKTPERGPRVGGGRYQRASDMPRRVCRELWVDEQGFHDAVVPCDSE